MSFSLTKKIRDTVALETGPKFVLTVLSTWADDKGECFPSIEAISFATGLEKRQIYRILSKLKSDGILTVDSGGGRGNRNRYKINLETLSSSHRIAPLNGDIESPLKTVTSAPLNGDIADPETVSWETQNGDICDIAIRKKHHEAPVIQEAPVKASPKTASEFTYELDPEIPPRSLTSGSDTSDSDSPPEGLHELNYASWFWESLCVAPDRGTQAVAANAIRLYSDKKAVSMACAVVLLLARAQLAREQGETINRFWFTDGKHLREGNGTKQLSKTQQRNQRNREILREAAELRYGSSQVADGSIRAERLGAAEPGSNRALVRNPRLLPPGGN